MMNKDVDDFTFLCVQGKDVKALIVGGGNAALTKTKSLINKGFTVHCVAPRFKEEFLRLNSEKLMLIKSNFEDNNIYNYHIVVICTDSKELNEHIRELCQKNFKMFIDATEPEKSIATVCATASTKEVAIAVRIKNKNPKASKFLAEKIKNYLEPYDDYISFITYVRNSVDCIPNKQELLEFLSSEDFLFFFQKSYGEKILDLFYGGFNFEFKNSHSKK